jgi:hypothetical protein
MIVAELIKQLESKGKVIANKQYYLDKEEEQRIRHIEQGVCSQRELLLDFINSIRVSKHHTNEFIVDNYLNNLNGKNFYCENNGSECIKQCEFCKDEEDN